MKTWTKRLLTAVLALAMMVTMIPVVDAQAATKKQTLYKGEVVAWTDYSKVKSVSSSKKSVVSIKKDPENTNQAIITAKKPGTATVTIKTKYGTSKLKITVKKLDIKITMKDMGDGFILLCVKNNTKQTFTNLDAVYTLKDANGEVVAKDSKMVFDVVAGKTVYDTIFYSTYDYTVDVSQCSAKAENLYRSFSASYSDESSKVKATVTEEDNGADEIELSVKSTNKSKKNVSGEHFILLYDAQDKVIALKTISFYLKKGGVETNTMKINYGKYGYTDYDHYEIRTVAYSTNY